jgi:hypothetical protein
MSDRQSAKKTPPSLARIHALLANCLELALRQDLSKARDVCRAAKIVADGMGIGPLHVFDELHEMILSKPWRELREEFPRLVAYLRVVSADSRDGSAAGD